MKKGFIFSIEALFLIVLLLSSLSIFNYWFNEETTNIPTTLSHIKRINGLYFNESYTNIDTTNKYCGNYIAYTTNISSVTVCEDYNE